MMTSQHKPNFLFSLALLSIFTMVSSDTILTLLIEHSSGYNTISIKFNESMFAIFYICLCTQVRKDCYIKYNQVKQSFEPLAIQAINLNSKQQPFSNYYQCNNNQTGQEVKCHRLRLEDMTCKQTTNFTIVPRPLNIPCDLTCVGLAWFNPVRESLIYNSAHQIQTRCPDCAQPLSAKTTLTTVTSFLSTTTPSTFMSPTNTRQSQSLSTNSATKQTEESTSISRESMDDSKNDNGNDDNNSIPVIMGVVIGILSIILLAMAIILIVSRRKKHSLRESRQNSTTCTNVSNRRNDFGIDDYEHVGIEPTTSNTVSISDNTRPLSDVDLTTVSPGDDTNNRETVSTYVHHPHNNDMKHDEILDNFGYSTIDIGEEMSDGAEKSSPSYENCPDIKSEKMTNATGNDFPEHTIISSGHKNKQYYNLLTKEDVSNGMPSASYSPDSDLHESPAVSKTEKPSIEYVNSLRNVE